MQRRPHSSIINRQKSRLEQFLQNEHQLEVNPFIEKVQNTAPKMPQIPNFIRKGHSVGADSVKQDRFKYSYIQNSNTPGCRYYPTGIVPSQMSNQFAKVSGNKFQQSATEFVYIKPQTDKKIHKQFAGHQFNNQREELQDWTQQLLQDFDKKRPKSSQVEYLFESGLYQGF